jgi:GNAT superfamily N-acetyltransferase
VERVTHQDVTAICTLFKKVWDPSPSGVPVELVKSWQPTALEFTSWMGGVTYFAARKDGHLVGVIGSELLHGSCHLVHLAVDPDVRRTGVGSALVEASVEWAKKAKAASVWVDVLTGLAGPNALFPKLGFALVGVLHHHEWGEDVRLFERVV